MQSHASLCRKTCSFYVDDVLLYTQIKKMRCKATQDKLFLFHVFANEELISRAITHTHTRKQFWCGPHYSIVKKIPLCFKP